MSKTSPNVIPIDMGAREMFAKLMEMNDSLIIQYATLATQLTLAEIQEIEMDLTAGKDPREVKKTVARAIMSIYHPVVAIDEALSFYETTITSGALPPIETLTRREFSESTIGLLDLVRQS